MSKHVIVVGCNAIAIHNYDENECPRIENSFKIWNMTRHKLEPFAMHYDKDKRILYLPRGVDVDYVMMCLHIRPQELVYEQPYEYDTFDDVLMKYKPRDDRQKEALRFMLGLNEYSKNRQYSTLLVTSTTGFGKSFCCIYTMCYTKIKSIVISYSITILKQWKAYALQYTNMKPDDIYLIQGADSIHMLLNNRTKHINAKIFLVTHSSIRDFANNYGWDKVSELFKMLRVGQMFIDEAHRDFDNICRIAEHINIYKTYYVTATPSRSSKEENTIYQLSIKNYPKLDLYDPEQDKHINYIAIKYASRPTPKEKGAMYNTYGLDKNRYINYLVTKDNFYRMLRIVMKLVIKFKGPVLFYIDTNAAILKVYEWLAKNYPEFAGNIGIYSGLVPQELKVLEKKKRLILTTLKSGGTGENIDGLKMAVVLAAPFKSSVTAIQAAGRLRDKNTYFVELIDLSFQSTKKYYYAKLGTYNKYMLTVSDVNMTDTDLEERAYNASYEHNYTMVTCPVRVADSRFNIGVNPFIDVPSGDIDPFIRCDIAE